MKLTVDLEPVTISEPKPTSQNSCEDKGWGGGDYS